MPQVGLRNVVERLRRGLADRDTDGDLLERYVTDGDGTAFAELVRRHGPKVYAVCRRVLGQHQLAEDAYQATFVVLARKARAIQPRSAVGGFLYGVARRAALEAYAVSRRRKETLVGRVPDRPAPFAATDPDVLAMLDDEIANLSEALRAAVVLCELDGVGRAEAARQLGIAEGTLSSRLAAARKQLASKLKSRGVLFTGSLFAALSSSANAVGPPALKGTTASVTTIAGGVMRTMMLAKMKSASTLVVLATLFAVWSFVPSYSPNVMAAPVPKEAPDEGLIFVYNWKTGDLAAYSPDGMVAKEWKLKDGKYFLGMTPDGRKIAYASTSGRVAGSLDNVPLTVHLRDVGDDTPRTDTGIAYERGNQYHWSSDRKRVVRVQPEPAKADEALPRFRNTLYDVETKKATSLDVPDDPHQILGWGPDEKSFLTVTYSIGSKVGVLTNYRHHWKLFDPVARKSKSLNDTHEMQNLVLSPDGRSLFGPGRAEGTPDWGMYRLDVNVGTIAEVARHERQGLAAARWSPSGRRVAYIWYGSKSEDSAPLVIADADGRNARTVSIPAPGGTQRQVTVLGWFPAKATAPRKPERPLHPISAPPQKVKMDEGKIILSSMALGLPKFKILKPDGTVEQVLSPVERNAPWNIRVSPSGRQVAFIHLELIDGSAVLKKWTRNSVRVLRLDEKEFPIKTVVEDVYCPSIAWTADEKLAVSQIDPDKYATADETEKEVPFKTYLYDTDSREKKPLLLPGNQRIMDLSPDGKGLLCSAIVPGKSDRPIQWATMKELKPELLAGTDAQVGYCPRFSPNGKFIVGLGSFLNPTDPKSPSAIYVFDHVKKTENRIVLAKEFAGALFDARRIVWSPDGSRIAFVWKEAIPMPANPRRNFVAPALPGGNVAPKWYATRVTTCDADGSNPMTILRSEDDDEIDGLAWGRMHGPKNVMPKDEKPKQPVSVPLSEAAIAGAIERREWHEKRSPVIRTIIVTTSTFFGWLPSTAKP